MLVIADTSALIAVATCDGLSWLDTLFDTLSVPRAVFDEAIEDGKPQAGKLKHYLSGKVVDIDLNDFIIAAPGLGQGELQAMALYRHVHADRLLIDDLRARKAAQYNGINIVGSAGILLMAKNQGLITTVKPYLERISNSEVYLSEALVSEVLNIAGEA